MCGATRAAADSQLPITGLSPRVRGNLCRRAVLHQLRGPIPACAGQPRRRKRLRRGSMAYPRVCGATCSFQRSMAAFMGLSPRVRGNRVAWIWWHWPLGPIPACAGQPEVASHWLGELGAYPRVCGATQLPALLLRWRRGLSPRVRGNLLLPVRAVKKKGPIPACAGQPKTS